ncbi:teichoic acid D-Ala incorporation-associated protein DltX [Neobacillus sp. OS1-33]|uniref:teichoic acid D-Ala incorporation-associated protein DltX n=1 Tax=Neobacillus sp. OS1-33 TaxID=3070683 RepID=UPI0035A6CEED
MNSFFHYVKSLFCHPTTRWMMRLLFYLLILLGLLTIYGFKNSGTFIYNEF